MAQPATNPRAMESAPPMSNADNIRARTRTISAIGTATLALFTLSAGIALGGDYRTGTVRRTVVRPPGAEASATTVIRAERKRASARPTRPLNLILRVRLPGAG